MSTNFIYNETLIWVVDWVNTIFTSLYPIESIEDLRLGGVDYTNFGFVGNTITLTDAPTLSTGAPNIDYFKATLIPASVVGDKTFETFVSEIYEDIGQEITSYQYPRTMVERYVREELPLHSNFKVNPQRKVWTYSFNKANDYSAVSYSASSLLIGTIFPYTPATGKLLLWYGGVVNYTSINATSFLGISWLEVVYKGWDMITVGYAIPTWVKKISEVFVNGRLLAFRDFREYISTQYNSYTVFDWFLFLPRTSGETIITVTYTKDNINPLETSSIIDFEPEYLNVIRFAVEVKLFTFRDDERLANVVNTYKKSLRDYKSYIGKQVDWTNNIMRASSYGSIQSGNHYAYRRR